jgi:hypothetical protein
MASDPHPADLNLTLTCRSTKVKCAPSQQPGEICGGIIARPCMEGLVCKYPQGSCGRGDMAGTCTVPSPVCPLFYSPVCGCDGQTHDNECAATRAGTSVDTTGQCPPPMFCVPSCGNLGSEQEGWYDGCTRELIAVDACAGCRAECLEPGTDYEGWYSSCGGLIALQPCAAAE